jgi:hypothetical protein
MSRQSQALLAEMSYQSRLYFIPAQRQYGVACEVSQADAAFALVQAETQRPVPLVYPTPVKLAAVVHTAVQVVVPLPWMAKIPMLPASDKAPLTSRAVIGAVEPIPTLFPEGLIASGSDFHVCRDT